MRPGIAEIMFLYETFCALLWLKNATTQAPIRVYQERHMSDVPPDQNELELLIELAQGAKTFEQVGRDARRLGLHTLVHTNPARGITQRLRELTGISKESLSWFPVRCKSESATEPGGKMMHPFVLISTLVAQILEKDDCFFKVEIAPMDPDVVASSFVNSPEYLSHPRVLDCARRGETVVPIGLYSDGMKVL